jgi:cation:H+ antiporter
MLGLSLSSLIIIFSISALIIWFAGVTLAKATKTIDTRLKLGAAFGGLILLGISGSLPEIAIIYSAAKSGHIDVILGNLLGGIAIQTLLLVLFDFVINKKKSLAFLAGSKLLSMETAFAIILACLTLIGTFIPAEQSFFNVNPISIVLVFAWIIGLFILNKARKVTSFCRAIHKGAPGRKHDERRAIENHRFFVGKSTVFVWFIFGLASLAILIAGVFLEKSGTLIASNLGISTGIFAATIMALVASLPQISTGIEAIFIGDNHLAVSDIMGGNAFMLSFFLFADLLTKQPVLSLATNQDIFITIIGILMMSVYGISFLLRRKQKFCRLGVDSILQLIIYFSGIAALIYL